MADKKINKNESEKAEKPAKAVKDKKVEPSGTKTVGKKVEKPAEKKVEKKAEKVAPKKKEEKEFTDRVYHISKRQKDRKWQVKAEGDERAVKLFWTQEEAIDYAKELAGNVEGRIVIHKEDGSFRKLTY